MSCNTNVIHVQLSSVKDAQRVPVHLMPCEIEHNGPAQVSQYFNAATKDCKQGTHTHIFKKDIYTDTAQNKILSVLLSLQRRLCHLEGVGWGDRNSVAHKATLG